MSVATTYREAVLFKNALTCLAKLAGYARAVRRMRGGVVIPLQLIGDDAGVISVAINSFPAEYHEDYIAVQEVAQHHFDHEEPHPGTSSELAYRLRCVLRNWGAGMRGAPAVALHGHLTESLMHQEFHSSLRAIRMMTLWSLTVEGTTRHFVPHQGAGAIGQFDALIPEILNQISARVFLGNQNATYPMKTLLLLTGLMPAFDNKVRRGLRIAGFSGFAGAQYHVPLPANTANSKKITRLPFVLGQCLNAYQEQLLAGVHDSDWPGIIHSPGRVFDVLLFVQGRGDLDLFSFAPDADPWYDLE